ncbi:GIY-YIG nuclease family protein [Flavobacteriaceae bacterium]|nr:GIY-YIG nuclease family protein [Flavobacteriaceae bacterium]MDB3862016.1 GIY-YIG nuclease family protein [Flavobacteriaceae bacterium]MDC3354266.1 GIY-YIG nuclease family protein [Flavobacteriaceae bacterium]
MFTVYILYSKSLDRYYIGHTGDMKDRLHRHISGRSKSTRSDLRYELVLI